MAAPIAWLPVYPALLLHALEQQAGIAFAAAQGGSDLCEVGRLGTGVPFGQALEVENANKLSLVDGVLGGKLILSSNLPVSISGRPHFTVSQSEAGFEKVMQAATLTVRWQATAEQTLEIRLTAEQGE